MNKEPTPDSDKQVNGLENFALSKLKSIQFKETIGLYKKRLQETDSEEVRQQFSSYLDKAKEFTEIVKEQVFFVSEKYSNHHELESLDNDDFECRVIEKIITGDRDQILSTISQLTAEQLDKQYSELSAVLGLLMLATHSEFQRYLPQKSAFIEHLILSQSALQAYHDNNLDLLNELLKQLPYRSAFKDFRIVLKAVLASSSKQQLHSILDKIPESSPYSQIAKLLCTFFNEGSELFENLVALSYQQRNVIVELKGFNNEQIEFIEHLSRQYESLTDKTMFTLVVQYKSLCSVKLAQQFCQFLLASYPQGYKEFNSNFGLVNEFEENRIKALTCELNDNVYDADYYWHQCIHVLNRQEGDNHLKIALIFRHMANQQKESAAQIDYLIDSLDYDAHDHDSYLKIVNFYQNLENAETYQQWLNKSLQKFPHDTQLLVQAIQNENRNKKILKANETAEVLLKVDPLNVFAKQIIFSNSITLAQQLMREKKYDLVEKQIQQAEKLNLGKTYKLQSQVLRGLLKFAHINKIQGLQLLAEPLNKLYPDPVNRKFKLSMDALYTALPVENVLTDCLPTDEYLLSSQELAVLSQQIKDYVSKDEEHEFIPIALEKIKASVKKSILKQTYAEDLLIGLCQTLVSVNHYELMNHCAAVGVEKWNKPIWVYYSIYSDTKGKAERCSSIDVRRLLASQTQAKQEKDQRTKVLIDTYLVHYYAAHPQLSSRFLEKLFGVKSLDNSDDPMQRLFGHLSDEVLFQLDETIETLTKNTTPEQLAVELNVNDEHDNSLFLTMMQDPDVFNALMVVKAADQLGIEINVSIDRVFDCFSVTRKI